jgi:hypothetical protein
LPNATATPGSETLLQRRTAIARPNPEPPRQGPDAPEMLGVTGFGRVGDRLSYTVCNESYPAADSPYLSA